MILQPLFTGYFMCFIIIVLVYGLGYGNFMSYAHSSDSDTLASLGLIGAPVIVALCEAIIFVAYEKTWEALDAHLSKVTDPRLQFQLLHGCDPTVDQLREHKHVVLDHRYFWKPHNIAVLYAFMAAQTQGLSFILLIASMNDSPFAFVMNMTLTVILDVLARTNVNLVLMRPFKRFLPRSIGEESVMRAMYMGTKIVSDYYCIMHLVFMNVTNYSIYYTAFECNVEHNVCEFFKPEPWQWAGLILMNAVATVLTDTIGNRLNGCPGYLYIYSPPSVAFWRHFSSFGYAGGGVFVGAILMLPWSGARG
ncbi:uncharacterized protein BJ171DRAFT_129184 [Polychytrium aggregatum]|uniref:uncharacterized protein n=1 Tax=Polychytrium aggregatum TaxID=110093 RepID=UPI0022FDFDB9|nr:uncharacterized protein BJ171DRAFT_129184 [Polychytrium aggregatum]KAI9204126.1 hypothetical protein BJ171DRAFT_129184 [Polychytrium aggregatum]